MYDSNQQVFTGVQINGVSKKSDFEAPVEEIVSGISNEKFKTIIRPLIMTIQRNIRMFDDIDDKLFDLKMITIVPELRGKGVGNELCRRSIDMAGTLGLVGAKTECTGKQRLI